VDNPQELVYGRLPGFGLTVLGEKQARITGEYLESLKARPEVIITSPLLRTKTTAKILREFFSGIEIMEEKEIIEVDNSWQGEKKGELIKRGIWQKYLDYPSQVTGGEGYEGMQKRVTSWLGRLLGKSGFKELIVVSHMDVIRAITVFLERKPLDDLTKIPCAHASVTKVVIDRKMKLLKPVVYWEPNGA